MEIACGDAFCCPYRGQGGAPYKYAVKRVGAAL